MRREGYRAAATRKGGRGAGTDVRVSSGRGRPPKFGRPSQIVALTLPQDVLDALRTVHRDLGWAIVRLVESTLGGGAANRTSTPPPLAELAHLPGKRALIVIQPQACRGLRGISTIPLADGRAFLALDQAGGLADLEVAILDVLDATPRQTRRGAQLMQLRDIVRAWRRDPGLTVRSKSIIVMNTLGRVERQPLAPLRKVRSTTGPRRSRASGLPAGLSTTPPAATSAAAPTARARRGGAAPGPR